MKPIRKAVFPVAGMGTHLLSATKASLKEMLPIVNKLLIQYAVEEAVEAICTEMVFVMDATNAASKTSSIRHTQLETEMEIRHKDKLLEHVRNILPPNIPASTSVRRKHWAWDTPSCAPATPSETNPLPLSLPTN